MTYQKIDVPIDDMPCFPPQGREVIYLDSTESFTGEFNKSWDLTNNTFLKFESKQSYIEVGDKSLDLFLAGDIEKSVEILDNDMEEEIEYHKQSSEKGLLYIRVRPYVLPLSPYLQWEILSYQMSAKMGQKIYLFENSIIEDLMLKHCISDYMIFDDHTVMLHNYTEDGLLVGGWITNNREQIKKYRLLFDMMHNASQSLDEFIDKFPSCRLRDAD